MNLKIFHLVMRINEVKTLIKHISYNLKCKLDSITRNSSPKWINKMDIKLITYFAHVFISDHITIYNRYYYICYHCTDHRPKQQNIATLKI